MRSVKFLIFISGISFFGGGGFRFSIAHPRGQKEGGFRRCMQGRRKKRKQRNRRLDNNTKRQSKEIFQDERKYFRTSGKG